MARPAKKKPSSDTSRLPVGRVTESHGRHHYVRAADGSLYEAHRRGKRGDVVVGDLVRYSEPSGGIVAIEEILPRETLLYRSDEWRVKELASNIGQVAVVFASRPTFNPWFIWKALLAASKAGIEPLVIRNKTDIAEGADETVRALALLSSLGCRTASVSAGNDPEKALGTLEPLFHGRRTLLIGQSGMGKSTILNLLIPEARAETQEFSEALDLGKQTTTATRWHGFGADGAIVDSPGFQEFGLEHLGLEDVIRGMPDIARHAFSCRFANCRHLTEPGCGVKAALDAGEIDPKRYEFYRAMAERILRRKTYPA